LAGIRIRADGDDRRCVAGAWGGMTSMVDTRMILYLLINRPAALRRRSPSCQASGELQAGLAHADPCIQPWTRIADCPASSPRSSQSSPPSPPLHGIPILRSNIATQATHSPLQGHAHHTRYPMSPSAKSAPPSCRTSAAARRLGRLYCRVARPQQRRGHQTDLRPDVAGGRVLRCTCLWARGGTGSGPDVARSVADVAMLARCDRRP